MIAINRYKDAQLELEKARKWAAMLGQPYRGGGGGIGQLRTLALAIDGRRATIYYQEYNGANNYHPAPSSLIPHLEAAISAAFPAILADALDRQEKAVKEIANQAADEYRALMVAAGLPA